MNIIYKCENCGKEFYDENSMYYDNLCNDCAYKLQEELYEYSCMEGLYDDCLGV